MRLAKIADRPHALTLLLSGLALIVSILSLAQSWKAVRMSAASTRAALQATGARLLRDPREMEFLHLDLTLTNHGKVTALDVETAFEWEVTSIAVPIKAPTDLQPQHADFAPGSTRTVRLRAGRRFSRGAGFSGGEGLRGRKNQLLVNGVTSYTDELTGVRYRDVWCFQFDPNDPSDAESLQMRPCIYQKR